jgi:hypothetical protein
MQNRQTEFVLMLKDKGNVFCKFEAKSGSKNPHLQSL